MPTFYGTPKSETFLLFHYKTDVTVYADGVSDPNAGTYVPTENVNNLNLIISGSGNDYLGGGYGRDIIFGGRGDDIIAGSSGGYAGSPSGSDSIAGRDQGDYLDGGAGNDTIYGYGGDDIIFGGSGNDLIYGGSGHNTVHGGSGDDTIISTGDLWGGAGRDTFAFPFGGPGSYERSAVPEGDDTVIHDFRSGTDKIDLTQAFVSAAGVEVVKTDTGLELRYVSAYLDAQITLEGVQDIARTDVLFNGDLVFV
jgi:Ca2+-binding RTX toxin-like protein